VKPFEDRGFFMLGFHYGFSGNAEFDSGVQSSAPLASTYGFNLRGDVPIERFLVLGPLFQFGAWRADTTPEPSPSYYIDVDLYIRARLPIATQSTNFQFWAGVPIGLTVRHPRLRRHGRFWCGARVERRVHGGRRRSLHAEGRPFRRDRLDAAQDYARHRAGHALRATLAVDLEPRAGVS
jgi:hypothetical protein